MLSGILSSQTVPPIGNLNCGFFTGGVGGVGGVDGGFDGGFDGGVIVSSLSKYNSNAISSPHLAAPFSIIVIVCILILYSVSYSITDSSFGVSFVILAPLNSLCPPIPAVPGVGTVDTPVVTLPTPPIEYIPGILPFKGNTFLN